MTPSTSNPLNQSAQYFDNFLIEESDDDMPHIVDHDEIDIVQNNFMHATGNDTIYIRLLHEEGIELPPHHVFIE